VFLEALSAMWPLNKAIGIHDVIRHNIKVPAEATIRNTISSRITKRANEGSGDQGANA
jgi:hypothetical protein